MRHISFLLITFLSVSSIFAEGVVWQGTVHDLHSQEPLAGVEIVQENRGTVTSQEGTFEFRVEGASPVTVRLIGYETQRIQDYRFPRDIYMVPTVLEGQTIAVSASRVIPGVTPVAYTQMDARSIQLQYSVEDVPMVLAATPGVHAYSESGNGTGYSYVSIRGFDQSRIAVMLDNVPLNDNESHQVYWVDHADILSDASDVEIQRGVGKSLYGATAFGGSINVNTKLDYEDEAVNLSASAGSYNTSKLRVGYRSGARLGEHTDAVVRISRITSDGYRDDSRSEQLAFFGGVQLKTGSVEHAFRSLVGNEVSTLQWDGITAEMLQDPELRIQALPWTVPFTDDFTQTIHSLHSQLRLSQGLLLRNTAYLVTGSGYYEVEKVGASVYDYNLDVSDLYPDSLEMDMETDLLRRKWIANHYYGIVPVLTLEKTHFRLDVGGELRWYTGHHFGEVSEVSHPDLKEHLPAAYRYYDYTGSKTLSTAFVQALVKPLPWLTASMDLQMQNIHWTLDQEKLGHAPGVDLSADWFFFNPRFGLSVMLRPQQHLFLSVGQAQKEPADSQIIEADDVWSTANPASPEKVVNGELGWAWYGGKSQAKINMYTVAFQNEVLQDIYDFQEGVFTQETADKTVHEGLEFEAKHAFHSGLSLSLNGSIAKNAFTSGELEGNTLANVPSLLLNSTLEHAITKSMQYQITFKHVGQQFIDQENTEALAIAAYTLTNLGAQFRWGRLELDARVNNVLNVNYATYGYAWGDGYYWPGAMRNMSLGLNYSF